MKSMDRIKAEIAYKNSFDSWDDLMCNGVSGFKNDCINEAMESYAAQEREKAEAEKQELAKSMNRQFSIEFERLEAEKKAFALRLVDIVWHEAFEDKSVPSTEWANHMINEANKIPKETANGLNEPKPEK